MIPRISLAVLDSSCSACVRTPTLATAGPVLPTSAPPCPVSDASQPATCAVRVTFPGNRLGFSSRTRVQRCSSAAPSALAAWSSSWSAFAFACGRCSLRNAFSLRVLRNALPCSTALHDIVDPVICCACLHDHCPVSVSRVLFLAGRTGSLRPGLSCCTPACTLFS